MLFLIFFVPLLFHNNIALISFIAWLIWVYAIANSGQRLLLQTGFNKANLTWVKFNYMFLLAYFATGTTIRIMGWDFVGGNGEYWKLALTIPVSLYSFVAIMQVLYTASIITAKLELNREVRFWNDAIGHLLRIVVYPLGVWGVHPIVRRAATSLDARPAA